MAADLPSGTGPARTRPWLLLALAATVIVAILMYVMPGNSAAPAAPPSNRRVPTRAKATPETVKPGDLEVHLDALKQSRPSAAANERNPFRFYVPPPPPPPPVAPAGRADHPEAPPGPVGPPPPPPITLKFIGVLDVPNVGKLAVFSDCRVTMRGKEGDIIDGRYRLVKIGVESVVMEYPDGRGRTTIRMSGQECVGK
jgi:hypothetical protein